jgi:hypothetical protein
LPGSVIEPALEIEFLEKERLSMSRCTTSGLTILLAFAPAALAVDGTVLINQSTVTNGLTGCPTGHFPIVICQSGSYRLSGNITLPDASTAGIVVSADNVTIDLNGFSIIGPDVCSGSPVTSCSPQGHSFGIGSLNANVIVLNGDIHGFGAFAIDLNIDSRIENVHVANNGFGGIRVGQASKVTNAAPAPYISVEASTALNHQSQSSSADANVTYYYEILCGMCAPGTVVPLSVAGAVEAHYVQGTGGTVVFNDLARVFVNGYNPLTSRDNVLVDQIMLGLGATSSNLTTNPFTPAGEAPNGFGYCESTWTGFSTCTGGPSSP